MTGTNCEHTGHVMNLLRLVAKYELSLLFSWYTDDDGTIVFYINCNDLFAWACGDAEDIEPADLPELERAITDCKAADKCAGAYGPELFVCRKRQMRPQGAAYPKCKALWPLFDAAGQERDVDSGNPKTHPSMSQGPKEAET
jgi:hypothetical protein